MRLAYADPPYPGCAHLYPEKTEVDHRELIERLAGYDGWALSTNENALQELLPICPPGVRVLAWCKSNAPPFDRHPFHSWEPVICQPGRPGPPEGLRVAAHIVTPKPGGFIDRAAAPFPGVKPAAFCDWIIRCLGAVPGDRLDDLYPGTGTMGEAWSGFQTQLTIFSYGREGGSRRHGERVRRGHNADPLL